MKKSTKEMILVVTFVLMIGVTACQATPEDLVVKSKSGDALEEAISETADDEQALADTDHVERTIVGYGEKIAIKIDADVILPDQENLPVAKVERGYFSQDEMDQMIDALFGDAPLYDASVTTKDELEKRLVSIKRSSTDLESDMAQSNGIETIDELKTFAGKRIAETLEEIKTAPETIPEIETLDVSSEYISVVGDGGKQEQASFKYSNSEYDSSIGYYNYGNGETSPRSLKRPDEGLPESIDVDALEDAELLELRDQAIQLVSDMGAADMELSDVFYVEDITNSFTGEEGTSDADWIEYSSDRMFYVFSFSRVINGIPTDTSFYSADINSGEAYNIPLQYEEFELWYEDDSFVQFEWNTKHQITELENENVAVQVDLEQAIETMANQAAIEYAEQANSEYVDELMVSINTIEVTLARIRDKNSSQEYLIIPVWDFYGSVNLKATEANADKIGLSSGGYKKNGDYFTINDPEQSFMTINTLDGSIIDRSLGY